MNFARGENNREITFSNEDVDIVIDKETKEFTIYPDVRSGVWKPTLEQLQQVVEIVRSVIEVLP